MNPKIRARMAVGAAAGTVLILAGAGPALAAGDPAGTGQPSQTCLSSTAPSEPGSASTAPGSAFNETGPGTAGQRYAGQQPQTQSNPDSVSQYDVACFEVSQG